MVDRPWTPVEAPATDRTYLALVSYLPLKRFRTVPRFLRSAGAIAEQLERSPGLVGFAFRAKILARKFYTLSVWDDEGSLMAFVGAEPHRGAMRGLRTHMGTTKFVRWKVGGAGVPPSSEDALDVLRSG